MGDLDLDEEEAFREVEVVEIVRLEILAGSAGTGGRKDDVSADSNREIKADLAISAKYFISKYYRF